MLATILKLTCRNCFRLQIPEHVKLLLLAKLKLLQEGFFSDVRGLEQEVISALPENREIREETYAYVQDIIESYIQNLHNRERYKAASYFPENYHNVNTKNSNMEFQAHVDEVLKTYKVSKICTYCHELIPKISTSGNKIMMPKSGIDHL